MGPQPLALLQIRSAGDLDAVVVLQVAAGAGLALDPALLDQLDAVRGQVLSALSDGPPVYGVSTGLGAMSEHRLSAAEQVGHQQRLLVARAAGGQPWLAREEVRAAMATRLSTLLNGDSGVSAALCQQLVALLNADVLPAVPATASGTAGEIIPLAHLAAALTGTGEVLTSDGVAPAGPALLAAGLAPYPLQAKEGIALIEGTPVTAALAILYGQRAATAVRDEILVLAGQLALTGASRDSLHPALGRGDSELAEVDAELLRLAGTTPAPRSLQPPVSFRVSPGVLAHARRAGLQLDAAVARALGGVTDSPAWVGDRFVGTAGFSGYDLSAWLHLLTVALVGVAEASAARLHRLMDPAVSGLPAQLSALPGPQTGLPPVHKRAVGVVHGLRRLGLPAALGTVETSSGQEDLQSFSLESAHALGTAVTGLREVTACSQLALHQMRLLGAELPPDVAPELAALLEQWAALLPDSPDDRPWGLDLAALLGSTASS